ncbi:UNVERIFIED_CONTAM: hypothetical protein GTU68_017790 [Idotea baltica]|nr:hypothetical protein [Idotea baltica]
MASGTGSNARAILEHLSDSSEIQISLLLSNKSTSGVKNLSEEFGIPYIIFSKQEFKDEAFLLGQLKKHNVDFIILAGFLWLIPEYLVEAYPDKILNIHPSLLPKYGGRGMYGSNVHQAVFESKDKISGLTIHIVNQNYDEGQVVFQKEVNIEDCLSPDEIATKVLRNEHEFYPKVATEYILNFK